VAIFGILLRFLDMPDSPQPMAENTLVAPQIPEGPEVYNTIMSGIEMELTDAERPLLQDKYKDETPEQAAERADRYNKAFAEYDRQYAVYKKSKTEDIHVFQRTLRSSIEVTTAGADDAATMQSLENQFSSAA
jgi:hypothetical protein